MNLVPMIRMMITIIRVIWRERERERERERVALRALTSMVYVTQQARSIPNRITYALHVASVGWMTESDSLIVRNTQVAPQTTTKDNTCKYLYIYVYTGM